MIKLDNKFTENLSPHEQLVMLQLLVGGAMKMGFQKQNRLCEDKSDEISKIMQYEKNCY